MARAADTFPLHRLVWHNRHQALDSALRSGSHDVELMDPRGRTPLELAVSLGHLESARVLLRHNANVGRENANGWTVLQEAVSTGDPEMVQLVLQYRDYQRATRRLAGIPELLSKLRRASDFYVEMKWEFTSWVPLVSKVCPSDVYRVWKRGESLRVDTTLLGFEHMTWQRGRRSYIFKGEEEGAVVMEVDHDKQVVYTETLALALHEPDLLLAAMQPSEEHVAGRLTSPIVSTHLDTRNIAFERNKSGIWGWRSEKMEVVSGYEAKVYSASNVELVTKTRTEHLSDQDKSRSKGSRTPFHSFLGLAQQHGTHNGAPVLQAASPTNPTAITPEEYFDPHFDLEARNIGRPIEVSSKVQRFKATLWLCEQHPLSLAEQVTPIIDLMAISNAHFAKLRDFITLKLPPGFPVKIEIPLFHVLNARITFSNLCGCDQPLGSVRVCAPAQPPGAQPPGPGGWPFPCEVEPGVFEVPPGYTVLGAGRSEPLRDEDDDLLQFAIQQSLLDAGTETDQGAAGEPAAAGGARRRPPGGAPPGGRRRRRPPPGYGGAPRLRRQLRGAAAAGHGAVGAGAGGARAAPAGGGRGAAAHPAPLPHRQVARGGARPGPGALPPPAGPGTAPSIPPVPCGAPRGWVPSGMYIRYTYRRTQQRCVRLCLAAGRPGGGSLPPPLHRPIWPRAPGGAAPGLAGAGPGRGRARCRSRAVPVPAASWCGAARRGHGAGHRAAGGGGRGECGTGRDGTGRAAGCCRDGTGRDGTGRAGTGPAAAGGWRSCGQPPALPGPPRFRAPLVHSQHGAGGCPLSRAGSRSSAAPSKATLVPSAPSMFARGAAPLGPAGWRGCPMDSQGCRGLSQCLPVENRLSQ
uniref:Ankyrin repeat domain 13D n=1 Tax=Cairina moschata TaxID=8855 RepID=A0A8C3BWK0_CAIMO